MANKNGTRAYTTLGRFLQEDGWTLKTLKEQYAYITCFKGDLGSVLCFAKIWPEEERFGFYVIAPVAAPRTSLSAIAEYITRANFGLHVGNFELDYTDGEIRYKSCVDFKGIRLTPDLIKHAVYPAAQTAEAYFPGLLRVIRDEKTPVEAIAEAEVEGLQPTDVASGHR